MSKNLRNDYLRLYPHLFEKQICKICGKEFYLSYERIKGIVRSIKTDKNFVLACCKSHTSLLQVKLFGSSLSDKELHKRIDEKKRSNIDENGLNSYQRGVIKGKNTKMKNHNDPNYNNRPKMKRTKFINHGDSNYNNIPKNKQTKFDRYGDENWNNREKCKETAYNNIDELGRNSYDRGVEKTKITKLNDIDKFGRNSYQRQSLASALTQLKNWGTTSHTRTEHYRRSRFYTDGHKNFDDINEEFFRQNFIIDNHFDVKKCCDYFKVSKQWVILKKRNFHITNINKQETPRLQNEVVEYIQSIYQDVIKINNRTLIKPSELDIYLPYINLAIEFNGIYWHSILYREKSYHQDKTLKCLKKGINLIHIYEDEWINHKNYIKNILFDRIYCTEKIKNTIEQDKSNNKFIILNLDKDDVLSYLLEGFKIFCILNPNEHTCEERIFYDSGYIILYYNQLLLPYLH